MNKKNKDPFFRMLNFRCQFSLNNELNSNISDEEKRHRKKAYEKEMDVILSNGYTDLFLFAHDVKSILEYKNIPFLFKLNLEYSYVAFLLGITNLHPLKWRFHNEILYDYTMSRSPVLLLHVPLQLLSDISSSIVADLSFHNIKLKSLAHDDALYKEIQITTEDSSCDVMTLIGDSLLDSLIEKIEEKGYTSYPGYLVRKYIFRFNEPWTLKRSVYSNPKLKKVLFNIMKSMESGEKEKLWSYLLSIIPIETCKDLYRILAICVAFTSYGSLMKCPSILNQNFEYTRDQIVDYLLDKDVDLKTAFGVMEEVRKAKGICPHKQLFLMGYHVSPEFFEHCNNISFLPTKALIVNLLNITIFLSIDDPVNDFLFRNLVHQEVEKPSDLGV